MPQQIVFPCPNCGATQSVDETTTSTQCQFCGNTISVPAELRPKAPPPAPAAPSTYSFGGASVNPGGGPAIPGMSGMAGLPAMFMGMDVNKLRAMAMAARAGNIDEAARLYSEAFGVPLDQARQAAEMMAQHHHIVLSQTSTSFGNTPIQMQFGNTPQVIQQPSGGVTYNLPSPPVMGSGRSAAGRTASACTSLIVALAIALGIGVAIVAVVFSSSPSLFGSVTNLFNQATNQYPRVALTFGGKGTGSGQFQDPRAIAIDGTGNVYVGDYGTGQIAVFDTQGNFKRAWTVKDEKSPHIEALAATADGKVYAIVSGTIYGYNGATGSPTGPLKTGDFNSFNDVRALPGGGVAATSFSGNDDVVLFDSQGKVTKVIKDAISEVTGDADLDMKVAVDGSNNLFILGTFSNAVFHYNDAGHLVNHFGAEGNSTGQFQAPADIAADDSHVYVSDDKGIQVFAPDGRYLSLITLPDYAYVFGMDFDAHGALYAVANTGKVYKILLTAPAQ